MNRQKFLEAYEKLSNREKLDLLAKLSEPWIQKGAIDAVPTDVNVILDLQGKSKETERGLNNQKNTNFTKKKKRRK